MKQPTDLKIDEAQILEEDDGSFWHWKAYTEPDACMSIMEEQGEGVWCGRIEFGTPSDQGAQRPKGFTGRSERLDNSLRDYMPEGVWWEVPKDIEIGSEVHQSLRQEIVDLWEFGYTTLVVECTHHRTDGYERRWVDSLSGLGAMQYHDDVVSEVLGELIYEMEAQGA